MIASVTEYGILESWFGKSKSLRCGSFMFASEYFEIIFDLICHLKRDIFPQKFVETYEVFFHIRDETAKELSEAYQSFDVFHWFC